MLGGCSSINGMIYQRGQQRDYDMWKELSGSDEWGWDDMATYFDRSLDYSTELANGAEGGISFENDETEWNMLNKKHNSENDAHSTEREWHVEKQRLSWEVLDDFRVACEESGIPIRAHFNSSDQEGCGYFQVNQKSGFRLSSHGAFLKPVLSRSNLHVETHQHVEKILFNNEGTEERGSSSSSSSNNSSLRATGVMLTNTKTKETRVVKAKKEIVLSAGAIGSPHILQCSGVGRRDTLSQHGIETLLELDGKKATSFVCV